MKAGPTSAKIIRLKTYNGGPGPNAAKAIAEAKHVLRTHDVRGVALVVVGCNGDVGTLYGGADEGLYHHLRSGLLLLQERISRDAET